MAVSERNTWGVYGRNETEREKQMKDSKKTEQSTLQERCNFLKQ